MARPTDYTDELAAGICARIAEGESLRGICAGDDMPDKSTVLRWLSQDDKSGFRDQYARAREAQADALFDQILTIADDASKDMVEKQLDEDGPTVAVVDHEHIARSRLRVDTRKWMTGKLAPKKYGDKVAHEHAGADGGPIKVTHQTSEQVKDELAHIFGAAAAGAAAGVASAFVAAGQQPAPAKSDVQAERPAEQPGRGDPVLPAEPDGGSEQEPAAPAPGEALAGEERPFLSFDDDL